MRPRKRWQTGSAGWVCAADTGEIAIGDLPVQVAGYGTERLGTLEVCGDTDNGFGLLFNWKQYHSLVCLLHTLRASHILQSALSRSKYCLRRFFRESSHGRFPFSRAVYNGKNIRRTEKYNTVRQERPYVATR